VSVRARVDSGANSAGRLRASEDVGVHVCGPGNNTDSFQFRSTICKTGSAALRRSSSPQPCWWHRVGVIGRGNSPPLPEEV